MIDALVTYFRGVAILFCEAAPYLMFGFLIAGILKVFIPQEKIYRHLGADNFRSVLLASLFGVPLPLCSCSVIPTAVSLQQSGASRGATASFLISTPETGVDSISITYGLLDLVMTIVRPVAAFLTAITTGSIVNFLVVRGWDRPQGETGASKDAADEGGACGCAGEGGASPGKVPDAAEAAAVSAATSPPPKPPLRERALAAVRYGYGTLLDDLTQWFVLGFLISGLIAVAVPTEFFENFVPRGWATSVLMLVLGTPMYICATASTPVAAALIAKGLDPGAALVFLLVGPATNITTLIVVARFLGRRVLVVYLACIAGFALVLGAVVNRLYAWLELDLTTSVSETLRTGPGAIQVVAGIVFLVLLLWSMKRIRLVPNWTKRVRDVSRLLGFDPLSRRAIALFAVVLLVLYGLTAASVVGPGEAGWVLRFGKVVRTLESPGLYFHLPAPIDRVKTIRPLEVRGVELGFYGPDQAPLATGAATERSLAAEAEMMTGEEALLRITYAVHIRVSDPYAFAFRLEDAERLTRVLAESSIRQVVAQRDSSTILVADRRAIEEESAKLLQAELDRIRSGIHVVGVNLRDVHAPPEVHFAFRDIASALEDQEQYRHQAEGNRAEEMADAVAASYEKIQQAAAYRQDKIDEATGRAVSFLRVLAAYAAHRDLTRLRLYLEAAEKALRRTRNIFVLGEDVQIDMYKMKAESGTGRDMKVFPPPAGREEVPGEPPEPSPLLSPPAER